jgi:poly-gamma-glutamate synthesis protein (capsule biosynthesis protein)
MKKYVKIILLIILLTAATTAVSYLLFYKKIEITNVFKQDTFLASLYNNKDFYESVFSKLSKTEKTETQAGIVSHHLLASDLIAEFYNKISSDKDLTIFLISPDHYNHFFLPETLAYTSDATWNTPYREILAEKNTINSLTKKGIAVLDNSTVGLEHGIYIQIPFIKNFFPNAKIVPLVLNNNANLSDFEEFGKKLNSLNKNSILIVSSDFSHNLSYQEAQVADKKSVEALKNLNLENIKNITNDCKQCMAVLSGFLGEDKNNYKFSLQDNKNSFDISGEDKNSVTSYVSGIFIPKKDLQILFTGDLMFDRGIRYYADKIGSNEFIFNEIYPILANQDLVVSNLEGPITDNKSMSSGSAVGSANNYIFTFDKSVAKTLYSENIKLVNLGNNHILNFGKTGLASTERYLKEAGVDFFGGPDDDRSIIKKVGDFKIGFISYNEFFGSANLDEAQTIAEIQNLKNKTDLIIVLPHWGIEYTTEPTQEIRDIAHQFINAGADLIIGSHPHVIQSIEDYNGKKIYYSLGNFIFDQYFQENVRNGLGVIVKIDPKTKFLKFEELSFYLQTGGQTVLK